MEQGATLTFTSWRSRTPRGPSKRGFTRVPCSSSSERWADEDGSPRATLSAGQGQMQIIQPW